MPPAVPAPSSLPRARPYWFPLLLFGGLAALSLPLSVLASPRWATPYAMLTKEIYPTVTQAMYFGGNSASAPFPFPLGWYWVGVLLSGLLITAAWYRWQDRRTGRSTPLRGYLVTRLVLVAATVALPLLAWGTPIPAASLGLNAWSWLDSLWRLGTFALLAIGVGLAILARAGRSRTLGVLAAVYVAAVCLAGWLGLQQSLMLPAFPYGDPGVLLPSAVLLLSGLGLLLAAGLRELRR
jgi:hypothetical protein